ncbi:MAG: hypothetical protein ACR2J8_12110, partial [Thermomicrobiales bacterium]
MPGTTDAAASNAMPETAANPCAAALEETAQGAPHCDWFDMGGMELPSEVEIDQAAAPRAAFCAGSGTDGKRVQPVLFVREGKAKPQDISRALFQVRTAVHGVDVTYQQSGLKTGSARSIRWVTNAACQIDVMVVEVPAAKTDGRAPGFYDAMGLLFGTPNQDRRL